MKDVTVRKNTLLVLLLAVALLPFLSISGIKFYFGTNIYQVWQTVSMFIFAALVLLNSKKIKANWAVAMFMLYECVILISSFIHHGVNMGILVIMISTLLVFILMQSDYCYHIIAAIAAIVLCAAVINIPSLLRNYNVHDAEFFIGGKNSLSMILIPGCFLFLINSFNNVGGISKSTKIMIILCMASVLLPASATGIIVTVFAAVMMVWTLKYKPNKIAILAAIFVAYLLMLILSDWLFRFEYWLSFTELLGKDSTLTSRANIWRVVGNIISDNWLFGAGRGTEFHFLTKWGYFKEETDAHNFILEILMQGGVVSLTIYAILFFKAIAGLKMNNMSHRLVFTCLCVILVNGLTESNVNNFIVTVILALACKYATEKTSGDGKS